MAETPDPSADKPVSEGTSKKDLIIIIATVAVPIIAVGAYFAAPGSALAVSIGAVIITIAAIVSNLLWGTERNLIAITTAVVVALAAGSAGGAIAWQIKRGQTVHSVAKARTYAPFINIRQPQGGEGISMTPVITGIVEHLAPNEVVWSFNEPFSTGRSPQLSNNIYPDSGPCAITASSFRCNMVFAGSKGDYCRQVRLWVAVLTSKDANTDENIKEGLSGNPYISVREDGMPSHVGSAVDHVDVHRNAGPKAC
jgi:hypothetical protein